MGKRVMLFDADLSLANAQIALGCRATYNMSHFLSGEKRLDEIVVTDTIPLSAEAAKCPRIRVISISGLLAETMLRISNEDSVSSLFVE